MRVAYPEFAAGFWQDMSSVTGSIDARTIRYPTRRKNTVSAAAIDTAPFVSRWVLDESGDKRFSALRILSKQVETGIISAYTPVPNNVYPMAIQWRKQQHFVSELSLICIKCFLIPVKHTTYRLHRFCESL